MRDLKCLRCGKPMAYSMTERFQLGQTGLILGDIPNLIAGSLELEIYYCSGCGKTEFFAPENSRDGLTNDLPKIKCPKCGTRHDFDYPKCPHCGHDYYGK